MVTESWLGYARARPSATWLCATSPPRPRQMLAASSDTQTWMETAEGRWKRKRKCPASVATVIDRRLTPRGRASPRVTITPVMVSFLHAPPGAGHTDRTLTETRKTKEKSRSAHNCSFLKGIEPTTSALRGKAKTSHRKERLRLYQLLALYLLAHAKLTLAMLAKRAITRHNLHENKLAVA